ncbi:conserved membrane hypothetical protein [Candidatus Desulfarcum epimagneticum]|uniref:GTPase n=1 Tax=uncultured Desulfobacteraceae bacterium TaxID=218296 RepID=A0A484HKX6_9BACT|nr:conserved membrane hypothetical protein [uncultured Desulfobacteraceae bacterium]
MEKEKEKVEKEKNDEVKEVSKEEVDKLIRHHMYSAFGIGLIPLPLLDMAALTGVQINLVRKLAKMHGVPFSRDKVKNILSSLVAGTASTAVGARAASYAKVIPIVGYSLGAVSVSVLGAASVYAVGKVFNQHFASGGTFLSFDSEKVKDYYSKMFKKGKETASDIKAKVGGKTADKGTAGDKEKGKVA